MNERPENAEGTENSASLEPGRAENAPERAGPAWKKTVLMVGAVAIAAAGAAITTLAATHKSAVRENATAYVNGLFDGYRIGHVDGYKTGFVDGVQASQIRPFEANPIDY